MEERWNETEEGVTVGGLKKSCIGRTVGWGVVQSEGIRAGASGEHERVLMNWGPPREAARTAPRVRVGKGVALRGRCTYTYSFKAQY